ncbi:hypothetical protein IMG5_181090 [Ichthyophthirius multifiliis]|uniref:B30.2/SPRY domain-containing protein n=1 Tax=Ichthyophthirius multifiliis TaxID=5932 RepID=G0R2W9_ICHMU|nr:hypothetical protein IMG5_181090 [Ichthyophthirius multifiliis]EGR28180.1 hypothetical protein IMG5_181090 [Ichthyophthirius multifiliis]|eukprot:XP_004027525.1 hypothetical protein IMG5_181090 [Ichthyophthirius multifiliis]
MRKHQVEFPTKNQSRQLKKEIFQYFKSNRETFCFSYEWILGQVQPKTESLYIQNMFRFYTQGVVRRHDLYLKKVITLGDKQYIIKMESYGDSKKMRMQIGVNPLAYSFGKVMLDYKLRFYNHVTFKEENIIEAVTPTPQGLPVNEQNEQNLDELYRDGMRMVVLPVSKLIVLLEIKSAYSNHQNENIITAFHKSQTDSSFFSQVRYVHNEKMFFLQALNKTDTICVFTQLFEGPPAEFLVWNVSKKQDGLIPIFRLSEPLEGSIQDIFSFGGNEAGMLINLKKGNFPILKVFDYTKSPAQEKTSILDVISVKQNSLGGSNNFCLQEVYLTDVENQKIVWQRFGQGGSYFDVYNPVSNKITFQYLESESDDENQDDGMVDESRYDYNKVTSQDGKYILSYQSRLWKQKAQQCIYYRKKIFLSIMGRVSERKKCQNGKLHQGECLNFICYDPECKNNGILCSICRIESHQNHKTIPLKLFLSDITNKIQNNQKKNIKLDYLLNQLEKLNQQILYSLKETVENMAQQIKLFETECSDTIKRIREKITQQHFMNENMPKVIESIKNGEYTDVDIFKSECKSIVESISYKENKGFEIDIKPEKYIDSFSRTEQECIKTIKKASDQFIQQIKSLQNTLQNVGNQAFQNLVQFSFSQTLKSSTITLIDQKISTQTQNQDGENRFALLEPVLQLNKTAKFAFQVKNTTSWVGLGICLKNILQKRNFKFDYNNTGNGTYLVSSNGYTWSHSSKDDNRQRKGFGFENDSVVICIFDPVKKVIRFKKHKGQQIVCLNVDIPENENVYACVNLCNKNDSIEIINDAEILKEDF